MLNEFFFLLYFLLTDIRIIQILLFFDDGKNFVHYCEDTLMLIAKFSEFSSLKQENFLIVVLI